MPIAKFSLEKDVVVVTKNSDLVFYNFRTKFTHKTLSLGKELLSLDISAAGIIACGTAGMHPVNNLCFTFLIDRLVRIVDPESGTMQDAIAHSSPSQFLVFNPSGSLLFTACGGQILQWELHYM